MNQLHPLALGALAAAALTAAAAGYAAELPRRIAGQDLGTGREVSFDLGEPAKASVIVFLSAKCPCSSSHEDGLAKLAREFGPAGIRFVAVHSNADEESGGSREHFARAALPFPVVEDPGAALADAFGAFKTPHVFVRNALGETLFQGGVDDSHVADNAKNHYLRDALLAIRDGHAPAIREARSLGCIIKRP